MLRFIIIILALATPLTFAQTLTRHPCFSDLEVEDPIPGYQSGDYVAVTGVKPQAGG